MSINNINYDKSLSIENFKNRIIQIDQDLQSGKMWLNTKGQTIQKDCRLLRVIKLILSYLCPCAHIYTSIKLNDVSANYFNFVEAHKDYLKDDTLTNSIKKTLQLFKAKKSASAQSIESFLNKLDLLSKEQLTPAPVTLESERAAPENKEAEKTFSNPVVESIAINPLVVPSIETFAAEIIEKTLQIPLEENLESEATEESSLEDKISIPDLIDSLLKANPEISKSPLFEKLKKALDTAASDAFKDGHLCIKKEKKSSPLLERKEEALSPRMRKKKMAASTDHKITAGDFVISKQNGKLSVWQLQDKILGKGNCGTVELLVDLITQQSKAIKSDLLPNQTGLGSIRREFDFFEKMAQKQIINGIELREGVQSTPTLMTLNVFETEQIVMGLAYDYFNLGSLDKIIHENILSSEDKLTIFNKLCKGIAYLKQLGISHGDIKPANILLHRNADGSLEVVIADLGGARSIDEAISDQEIPPLQTPGYTQLAEATLMAPLFINCETEKFLRMSQLRDLFSLGATLFELFTGKVLIEMAQSQDDSAAGFAGFKMGVLCKEAVENNTVEKMIQESQISNPVEYPLLQQALETAQTPDEITKHILKLLQINPLNRE